jgi:hypothetical protein
MPFSRTSTPPIEVEGRWSNPSALLLFIPKLFAVFFPAMGWIFPKVEKQASASVKYSPFG